MLLLGGLGQMILNYCKVQNGVQQWTQIEKRGEKLFMRRKVRPRVKVAIKQQ